MIVDYPAVSVELNTAKDNGYDMSHYSAEDLAYDLMAYSASFDGTDASFDPENDEHVADLIRACRIWKAAQ